MEPALSVRSFTSHQLNSGEGSSPELRVWVGGNDDRAEVGRILKDQHDYYAVLKVRVNTRTLALACIARIAEC